MTAPADEGARLYLLTPPLSGPSTFDDALKAALDAAPVAKERCPGERAQTNKELRQRMYTESI